MSFGKGSNTTTQTTQPNPAAMQAYMGLLNRAGQTAQLPWQAYGGEFTAPINAQQQAGFANINANAGFASPYIQQGATYANAAAQPISAADIERYQSPYTQQVVNATEAQFNNQNAQQQQQVLGNAIAQGALGGDRTAVAQANLAGQQQTAEAPVIAGLYNTGYQNASNMALQEQQARAQAAYSLGNLGVAGQNAALQGAGAQVGAGSLEQQTQQALDQALYAQFMQQQAFPYQQLGWLAGIDTGVGSQMGGTSTTTPPPPNPWNTAAGLGLAGAALFAKRGGRIAGFAPGGMVSPTMAPTMPMDGAPQAPQAGFGQLWGRMQPSPQWQAFENSKAGQALQNLPGWGGWGDQGPMAGFGMLPHFDDGGAVAGFGGMPYGGARGWIPSVQIAHGNTMPKPAGASGQPQKNPLSDLKGLGAAGSGLGNIGSSIMSGFGEMFPETAAYLSNPSEMFGEANGGRVAGLYRGGTPGYDDGGDVPADFADRFRTTNFDNPELEGALPGLANAAFARNAPLPRPRPAEADTIPPDNGKFMPVPAEPEPEPIIGGGGESRVGPVEEDQPRSGFGHLFGLSDAAKTGLMAAGLGMMASRSPFLGQAIGEGGLQGLSAYSGEKKQEVSVEHARKLLEQHAEDTRKKLEMESARLAQAKEAQTATQAYRNRVLDQGLNKLPPGYRMVNGELEAIPGGPADPEQVAKLAGAKKTPGTAFNDDTVNLMAEAIRAGNTQVLTNLGAGAMKSENVAKVWNKVASDIAANHGTGADLAAARANFNAQMGAAKSQAVRAANVEANIEEARQTFPLALEASHKVPRTEFVPLNKAIQMVQAGTSSPALKQFVTANAGVITAYSQAMARAGVATVDGRHAAEALLSTADGPEAYEAVLQQMEKEMHAAAIAPETVRQGILARISGRPAAGTPAPGGGGFTGRTATGPGGQKLRETSTGQWVP